MTIYTYAPNEVIVNLGAIYQLNGFATGTFVSIKKEVKPFRYRTSMDGETARVYTKDNTYEVSVVIQQTSPTNNILGAIHQIDVTTGLGKFPLIIKDKSGTTSFFSPSAWIETQPETTFSTSMETRTWVFKCTDGILVVGGNSDPSLLTEVLQVVPQLSSIMGTVL